ncbi:GGDEF domain-containing protein [Thalassoglobus polymorphus]|uniref:diguanylate cyclase n=1 Tax=Thalassoglobus polymorphus TaxID=2527994 RepID=A0A517QM18_9PLAN|nr:GGDEF domain-containing protein [Thalassoglobus polymorphus]QDT32680.1 Phytochrome-like protein cph2 [Thalassoglobus polymorphus]
MVTLQTDALNLIGLMVAGSFVSGLLLWSRFRYLQDQSNQLLKELAEVQQTSKKSRKKCEKFEFEVDWLKLAQLQHRSEIHFLNLWKSSCENPEACLAWLVLNGDTLEATDHSQQSPDVVACFPEHLNYFCIERSSQQNRFQELPEHIEKLHLFRCAHDSPERLILIVSQLPCFATERIDLERLSELTGFVKNTSRTLTTADASLDENLEDLIAREMLEIRSLLDVEFQSPTEMMEGFLNKLACLSGYEFASLYLSETDSLKVEELSHFASGGILQGQTSQESWNESEQKYLQSTDPAFDQPLIITPESILECDKEIPFRCGLLIPVRHEQESIGLLFLTHSDSTMPSDEDARLIEWASTFLIQTLNKELTRTEIMDQARRDPLTHLANRRTFDLELDRLMQHANHANEPLSLVLVDIDHFKAVNDQFGHPTGDVVLQQVANILAQTTNELRVTDHAIAARYGGEEFALILPNIGEQGAVRIANQIREAIADQKIQTARTSLSVTASFGVAAFRGVELQPSELIQLSDVALYQAKNSGRNQVCSARELLSQHPEIGSKPFSKS